MATDLVTASFDILANAMYRNEPSQAMFSLKSFLVNKIPLLLTQLSASIFPMTPEMCITQALSHVDPSAFPSFSQGFDDMLGSSNSLSEVRQDFLNSCALHGLIPASAVERLLGETPMQGPPETKYSGQVLFEQCKRNFEKVGSLIDELENLDGNAGAIVRALTEVTLSFHVIVMLANCGQLIGYHCTEQGSMYLKTLCNLVTRKPQALDVILQFTSPSTFLRPLCQFLDEWKWDPDQGNN